MRNLAICLFLFAYVNSASAAVDSALGKASESPAAKRQMDVGSRAAFSGPSNVTACDGIPIECGQTIAGTLVPACEILFTGAVDYFQFLGTPGESVTIVETSTDFAPSVFLFQLLAPNAEFLSANGTTTLPAVLTFKLDQPGLWVIGASSPFGFFSPGSYTLSLQCSPANPGGNTLSLNNGRFTVEASWANQFNGTSGTAFAMPISDSTGFFYFTDPSNFELIVKILNINNVIKLFYGELTDLHFTINVTDNQTGAVKTYHNTPGDCGAIDENAFVATSKAGHSMPKQGSCTPGGDSLCLLDQRFAISVTWMNQYNGDSGTGTPESLSDQSGLFSFTDPTDVEFVMKVVDFGDRTAFFYSALSDFEYDITVTDTVGRTTKTYHNPAGQYCGGLDNTAFPP
jgi:hypothetical protein